MSSVYADQGTAAHAVLETLLIQIYEWGVDPKASRADVFVGSSIKLPATKPGDHARLSPSGAKGWMHCAQNPQMADKYPEPPEPERWVRLTQKDMDAVQTCLDYVESKVVELAAIYGRQNVTVEAEQKVSCEKFTRSRDTDGTSDIRIKVPTHIEHVDYKHGVGVPVAADDPQNEWYLLGSCADSAVWDALRTRWDIPYQTATLTVCQPRCDKVSPRVRSVHIEDVPTWMNEFLETGIAARAKTTDPTQPFNPSMDACRWCAAGGDAQNTGAPVCRAYVQHCLAEACVGGEGDWGSAQGLASAGIHSTRVDPAVITDETMVGLLNIREMVTGMFKAVEAHALSRLKNGTAGAQLAKHYKPVRGRTNRRFKAEVQDEEELVKRLKKIRFPDPDGAMDKEGKPKMRALKKSEMYVQALRSLAQLETVLKKMGLSKMMKEAFNALWESPPGKITIAPASDPRDSVSPMVTDPQEAFEGLKPGDREAPKDDPKK